ncbi:hypothetical protein LS482_21070 [Sinomicrobium kalidii]|uniref:hypothetical protein n=1 Tax=Sinomicrobium kalidii TaxID=2900738 RepID=UPI001E466CC0|nr:hypothetical protein [Sinomicrobium kalidii]UGU16156.1 hypothetical protein LS482_21070 [Sinomicrobium kalidii]
MKNEISITVEIFKTDIKDPVVADICTLVLSHHFPRARINFDLEDPDNILRVEDRDIATGKIIELLSSMDIKCTLFNE